MAAPVVQSLEKILAEINPAYAAQEGLYNQQIAGIPAKYEGQKAGLEVKKTNDFRDINRGANARGLAFSGMPIEEQTRYLGEQYLPGLAALDQQGNTETMELQKALAGLSGEKRLRAIDTRTRQQEQRSSYEQEMQRRKEEEKRFWADFNQRKAQSDREFSLALSNSQASRAAAAASSKGPDIKAEFASALAANAGGDGKVSPGTYNSLKNQFVSSGYGSYKDFHDRYWQFANAKYWWDYR